MRSAYGDFSSGEGRSRRDLKSMSYGDFSVDTVWTTGAHHYAETCVNTRVSASDLFRRRVPLTPFWCNKVRPPPWLVRNAEVGSSSLLPSTILRSRSHAKDVRRSGSAEHAAKADQR